MEFVFFNAVFVFVLILCTNRTGFSLYVPGCRELGCVEELITFASFIPSTLVSAMCPFPDFVYNYEVSFLIHIIFKVSYGDFII